MREILIKHAAKMHINVSNEQAEKLIQYLQLIVKWNRIHNLTAIRNQQDMLSHHLLDSLSVSPWVSAENLLDVGSGAGLPGIPLAILHPELRVTLSDSNNKKSIFQQQAQIELGLKNVTVKTGRVEDLSTIEKFDGIISRAFSEMALFTNLTQPLLTNDGRWYAMKGMYPTEELENLPDFVQMEAVHELEVPMLNAQRHLLVMKKK
jgi:16S rRNA (guanine527-N7)-methyltransferase